MPVITPLVLNGDRSTRSGSPEALRDAIRRGGDLRIGTVFRHNEHIDTASASAEPVEEVAEFRETLLIDGRWAAGIMTLRVPVELPDGFGPRPSMSFFLYNEDATQAIARPYLDGRPATGKRGAASPEDHAAMPRYHQFDGWDAGTNAPSSNFVYDFDSYAFHVNDRWTELLSHSSEGDVLDGARGDLTAAFRAGYPVKLAISGLCDDLSGDPLPHEIFVHAGSSYHYTQQGLFITGTHPLVRIRPAVPLRYGSGNWDFGWLVARTDGLVARWICDPYTLEFSRGQSRHAIRWFAALD